MQRIEKIIKDLVAQAALKNWDIKLDVAYVQVQKTKREFEGDFTVVVFPLLRYSKQSPEQTGEFLGAYLERTSDLIEAHNVIKGFLNLRVSLQYWKDMLDGPLRSASFGRIMPGEDPSTVMIEYSSPNTNKPLHLGHIRNNLLGHSVSCILKATGNRVEQVNLVNDRGIHITCSFQYGIDGICTDCIHRRNGEIVVISVVK